MSEFLSYVFERSLHRPQRPCRHFMKTTIEVWTLAHRPGFLTPIKAPVFETFLYDLLVTFFAVDAIVIHSELTRQQSVECTSPPHCTKFGTVSLPASSRYNNRSPNTIILNLSRSLTKSSRPFSGPQSTFPKFHVNLPVTFLVVLPTKR